MRQRETETDRVSEFFTYGIAFVAGTYALRAERGTQGHRDTERERKREREKDRKTERERETA